MRVAPPDPSPRILIPLQEGVYDKFAELVEAKVRAFKVGSGMEDGVTLGPLISQAAVERVDVRRLPSFA